MRRPPAGDDTRFHSRYWTDPYCCEWATVIGDRIRRIRRDKDWRLTDLAAVIARPEGGRYSVGYFSRIERGLANAPLYVYLAIAEAMEVDPARLLGPDAAVLEANESEMTLLRFLRRAGIPPDAALATLAAPR